jgi:hypothetical protein
MSTVADLWRGRIPLATTAWVYGGLALALFLTPVIALGAIRSPLLQSPAMLGLCLFVLFYAAFIAVAIWRSANNYGGWIAWRALAKGSVLVVFLQTAFLLAAS